jgi:hypothetical protein
LLISPKNLASACSLSPLGIIAGKDEMHGTEDPLPSEYVDQPLECRWASLYRTNGNAVNMQTVLIPVEFVWFKHPSQIK